MYVCLNKSVEWFKVQKNEIKALNFVTVLCSNLSGPTPLFYLEICSATTIYLSFIIEAASIKLFYICSFPVPFHCTCTL